jgi:hypothetical protein
MPLPLTLCAWMIRLGSSLGFKFGNNGDAELGFLYPLLFVIFTGLEHEFET